MSNFLQRIIPKLVYDYNLETIGQKFNNTKTLATVELPKKEKIVVNFQSAFSTELFKPSDQLTLNLIKKNGADTASMSFYPSSFRTIPQPHIDFSHSWNCEVTPGKIWTRSIIVNLNTGVATINTLPSFTIDYMLRNSLVDKAKELIETIQNQSDNIHENIFSPGDTFKIKIRKLKTFLKATNEPSTFSTLLDKGMPWLKKYKLFALRDVLDDGLSLIMKIVRRGR